MVALCLRFLHTPTRTVHGDVPFLLIEKPILRKSRFGQWMIAQVQVIIGFLKFILDPPSKP